VSLIRIIKGDITNYENNLVNLQEVKVSEEYYDEAGTLLDAMNINLIKYYYINLESSADTLSKNAKKIQ
jgi:hypothetical protein